MDLRKQVCKQILGDNVGVMSEQIFLYWNNHISEIKHALSIKGVHSQIKQKRNASTQAAVHEKHLEQMKKLQTAKDLLFIQSEIYEMLPANSPINLDFLSMILSILSIRHIHNPRLHNDDLLGFAVKSLVNLIPKV